MTMSSHPPREMIDRRVVERIGGLLRLALEAAS